MRKTGLVVAMVVASAAAVAHAEPEAIPGEARLATAAEVRAACAARGEAPPVYRVTLPSRAFAFAAYDAAHQRLPIDGARGFHPPKVGWELVLHDIGGPGAVRPRAAALEVAVPAAPDEAHALERAHDAGSLELTLWFQLAGGGDTPSCAAVHRVDEDGVRVAVEPMAFALSKGRERIAGGEVPAFALLRDPERPVVEPRVTVGAPMLTAAKGRAPDKVARAAEKLAPQMLGCYRKGLAADPALRGALVAEVEVSAAGRAVAARAEIDGLGAPETVACALDQLRAARFPARAERFSIPLKFGD